MATLTASVIHMEVSNHPPIWAIIWACIASSDMPDCAASIAPENTLVIIGMVIRNDTAT